jgi:hypothetical protein
VVLDLSCNLFSADSSLSEAGLNGILGIKRIRFLDITFNPIATKSGRAFFRAGGRALFSRLIWIPEQLLSSDVWKAMLSDLQLDQSDYDTIVKTHTEYLAVRTDKEMI